MQPYDGRRTCFAEAIPDAIAVIPSASIRLRNSDTEFEFRQDSDFHYLTGFPEPDSVLVVRPKDNKERFILFVRPRDRAKEIWNGRRYGPEGALAEFGVDAAYEIGQLDDKLADFMVGARTLYYRFGEDERMDRRVQEALAKARDRVRRGGNAPRAIEEPGTILHEMRLLKTPAEIEKMRRACEITRLGHVAGMRATRPGVHEYEIEATIEHAYRANGAHNAYPSIVASGDNATILHYHENSDQLKDGDLILVDSGCEYDLYASDVTRTWPINGRFSAEQRAIYEIVLAAQKAAIEEVRPGRPFSAYHEAAVNVTVDGLLDVGLLKGTRDEILEQQRYNDYFMHRTGHFLGLDVHDVGRYLELDGSTSRKLEAGIVVTVEPGIYVHRDLNCDERFKGIGVRIEDDILCTARGPENLSAEIPKEIAELESIVGADVLEHA
ncbi:MAG: aminopeptidase P N-terminal domain-containing protein [Candidatus Eremiobacteraeota bacterium]|nr:aminopeptidase P N-terminal domain-containing protein [Candidatus Eremiobacteraeota bacterium]